MGLFRLYSMVMLWLKELVVAHGLPLNLLIGFLVNILINAFIGLIIVLYHHLRPVPLFGHISISNDLIGMSVTLTYLVAWFNIETVREEIQSSPDRIRKNKSLWLKIIATLPDHHFLRVVIMTALFTLPSLAAINILDQQGFHSMSVMGFILFKSIYSGILAMGVIYLSSLSVYVKKS